MLCANAVEVRWRTISRTIVLKISENDIIFAQKVRTCDGVSDKAPIRCRERTAGRKYHISSAGAGGRSTIGVYTRPYYIYPAPGSRYRTRLGAR